MRLRNVGITAAALASGLILTAAICKEPREDMEIYHTSISSLANNRKDSNLILENEAYRKKLKEFETAYYAISKLGELDFIQEGYEYDIDSYLKEEADTFELSDIALLVDDFDQINLEDYRRLRLKNQLSYLNEKYKSWILQNGYFSASYLMKKMVESEVCSAIEKDFSECRFSYFQDSLFDSYAKVSNADQVIRIDSRSGNLYKMSKFAYQLKDRTSDSFEDTYKDIGQAMKYLKKSIATETVVENHVFKTR